MSTDYTHKPDENDVVATPDTDGAAPEESLEMPEPTLVVTDDGELVPAEQADVDTTSPEPGDAPAGLLREDAGEDTDDGPAGPDLADAEGLEVDSLREPSASERSWDYSNGPMEQIDPSAPTGTHERDHFGPATHAEQETGSLSSAVASVAAPEPDPTSLRRRSLFSAQEDVPTQAMDSGDAARTQTLPTGSATAVPGAATVAAPLVGAAGLAGPAATSVSDQPVETTSVHPAAAMEKPSRKSKGLPRTTTDVILDGSSVVGRPASRSGAHWAGVLVSLVMLPIAWFFLHGGLTRMTSGLETNRFSLSTDAAVWLGIGAIALIVSTWTARRSSVGAVLIGLLTIALGVPGLAVPTWANEKVTPFLDRLSHHSTLGADLARYFWSDAATGRFILLGLTLVLIGIVSHSARRAGRREQEVVDRVHRTS